MKNKTSLMLMELAVLLGVFALAAAICLKAFAWADSTSRLSSAQDRATAQAQNVAELIGHCAGDLEAAAGEYGGSVAGGSWVITYDAQWNQSAVGAYILSAQHLETGSPYLGQAQVEVRSQEGQVLTRLTVSWQEDTP